MNRWLPPVIALVLALILTLAGSAQDSGWVQLFNGKDLTGWKLHPEPNKKGIQEVVPKTKVETVSNFQRRRLRLRGTWVTSEVTRLVGYDGKVKDTTVPLWRVENGILIGSGPASHLFSERSDYENFHYKVEAMINDKGNSGQYFRTAFGPGFPQGYEAQINATHGDIVRTGSLYPAGGLGKFRSEIAVLNTAPHKANEWFTQEVIANGNHIVIKVNGQVMKDWRDPEHRYKTGHFALQGHDPGTVVKFKSIAVKELPPSKK